MYDFQLATLASIRSFVEQNHYSRSVNGVKVSYCFAIYTDDVLVGAALFGQLSTTAWKKYGTCEADVLELRRLVCDQRCPRNTESWFIARCLRWLRKNTLVKTVVSYADPYHGHVGFVYQASNWAYVGQTPSDVLLIDETGKTYHSRAMRTKNNGVLKPFAEKLRLKHDAGLLEKRKVPGKHTYLYALRGKCEKTRYPYPKPNS